MKRILQIRTLGGVCLISFDDIIYSQADGSYCRLHLKTGEELLLTQNLKSLTAKLDSSFLRISRSALVHCSYIKRIDSKSKTIHLANEQVVKYTLGIRVLNSYLQSLLKDETLEKNQDM